MLYSKMYVMRVLITWFGCLCGRSFSCNVSRHGAIPSSCGMFVYRLLTSIVSSIVYAGSDMDCMRFINCLLSFMYEGVSFMAGCSSVSMKLDKHSVGPLHPETIGFNFLESLCILCSM